MSKIPQTQFCEDHWEENLGKAWKLSFEILLQLGPMWTKKKNISEKKNQKRPSVWPIGEQQSKFERSPCTRFRNKCDTDGRRTDFDFMSSAAGIVKQS